MKKTVLFQILTVVILLYSGTNLQAQKFCESFELSESNMDHIVLQVENFYREELLQLGFPEVDEAMDKFRSFLSSEITNPGYEPTCDPGPFWYAGYTTEISKYKMYFRWNKESAPNSRYIGKVYDFVTGEPETYEEENPLGIYVETEGYPEGKLIFLNTFCENLGQSLTHMLIIVDRDLSFYAINKACENEDEFVDTGESEMPVPRLANPLPSYLKVYPNPSLNNEITIDFDLPAYHKVSIQLIAANSGKTISTILENEELERGNHIKLLQSDRLGAGLYYVVLQTENERIVRKLIRL